MTRNELAARLNDEDATGHFEETEKIPRGWRSVSV